MATLLLELSTFTPEFDGRFNAVSATWPALQPASATAVNAAAPETRTARRVPRERISRSSSDTGVGNQPRGR
jgi:hypothetical protein